MDRSNPLDRSARSARAVGSRGDTCIQQAWESADLEARPERDRGHPTVHDLEGKLRAGEASELDGRAIERLGRSSWSHERCARIPPARLGNDVVPDWVGSPVSPPHRRKRRADANTSVGAPAASQHNPENVTVRRRNGAADSARIVREGSCRDPRKDQLKPLSRTFPGATPQRFKFRRTLSQRDDPRANHQTRMRQHDDLLRRRDTRCARSRGKKAGRDDGTGYRADAKSDPHPFRLDENYTRPAHLLILR